MNHTHVRTTFTHDLKFDSIAAEIFSGLQMKLLILAQEVEQLMKKDSSLLKDRILFWNTSFIWSKNKEVAPRIDARVDLLDNRDLEPSRVPVLSAGFCGDIQITEDRPKERGLKSFAQTIADAIKLRHIP